MQADCDSPLWLRVARAAENLRARGSSSPLDPHHFIVYLAAACIYEHCIIMMITTYVLDYCMTDHSAEDFSHMTMS